MQTKGRARKKGKKKSWRARTEKVKRNQRTRHSKGPRFPTSRRTRVVVFTDPVGLVVKDQSNRSLSGNQRG